MTDWYHSTLPLQWRHNELDGVSTHQPRDCLLSSLLSRSSKKTSKFRVTGFCEGNSPVTGEFPAQRASNAVMFPFDDVINHASMVITLTTNIYNTVRCETPRWLKIQRIIGNLIQYFHPYNGLEIRRAFPCLDVILWQYWPTSHDNPRCIYTQNLTIIIELSMSITWAMTHSIPSLALVTVF